MSLAVRVLRADDGELLCRLFYRLSPESIYRRFFTHYTHPPAHAMDALVNIDHVTRDALVAVVDGEIVGVARYATLANDPTTAEIAVLVEDAWQGRGLGPRLLAGVTALARLHGIESLCATVLADNRPAITMLRRAFPDAQWVPGGAEYEVRVPLVRELVSA